MKNKFNNITILLIIVFLGVLFHKNFINEYPSNIHAWAQSDRYALAVGFTKNGLNFFKPETFVLNHQFPNNWEKPANTSITAVDFPMHDYIPAVIMKFLNTNAPWVFRLYVLIYSFIGLFFVFQLAKLLTGDFLKSVFITLFAATSPVFVYYQAGFLPTIPSLSNAFVGIYFYAYYLSTEKNRFFNISILFLTLATLSRTTFAIPLIAILGLEFLRILNQKTHLKPKIIPVVISLFSILAYFFYNNYLTDKYGSIFLNHIMPPSNYRQILDLVVLVKERWLTHYFSLTHYIFIALLIGLLIINAIRKKIKFNKVSIELLILVSVMLLGCVAFALLMLQQFPAHDYYFLDTFFLPVIVFLIILLSATPEWLKPANNYFKLVLIAVFSIPLIINAGIVQVERHETGHWDRVNATINNFKNAEYYLDSLNIPQNAKMLVIDAYAPNIPLTLMNRKGYVVMRTSRENISKALQWDFDYIVTQNVFFLSDVYPEYPEIITQTDRIWDNGKITVSKLRDSKKKRSLEQYLGLDEKTPVKTEILNFDEAISANWENVSITSDFSHSGQSAGVLTKEMDFGITYKTNNLPEIREKNLLLFFQSHFLLNESVGDVELVVSIHENSENTFYKSLNLRNHLARQGEWEKVNLLIYLPKVESEDYEFGLYIWNTGRTELLMDDFGFKIYQ